jgi:hypothetical protein
MFDSLIAAQMDRSKFVTSYQLERNDEWFVTFIDSAYADVYSLLHPYINLPDMRTGTITALNSSIYEVKFMWVPPSITGGYIEALCNEWGVMRDISFYTDKFINSRTYVAKISLTVEEKAKIPHLCTIPAQEGRILVTVQGRAPLCLACNCLGHVRATCPNRQEKQARANNTYAAVMQSYMIPPGDPPGDTPSAYTPSGHAPSASTPSGGTTSGGTPPGVTPSAGDTQDDDQISHVSRDLNRADDFSQDGDNASVASTHDDRDRPWTDAELEHAQAILMTRRAVEQSGEAPVTSQGSSQRELFNGTPLLPDFVISPSYITPGQRPKPKVPPRQELGAQGSHKMPAQVPQRNVTGTDILSQLESRRAKGGIAWTSTDPPLVQTSPPRGHSAMDAANTDGGKRKHDGASGSDVKRASRSDQKSRQKDMETRLPVQQTQTEQSGMDEGSNVD